MKNIIINADDFGRGHERNNAIDYCIKNGLINSIGLIVTGKNLEHAVELMNEGGYHKHVHLHFNMGICPVDSDTFDVPLTKAVQNDSFFCENGYLKKCRSLSVGYRRIAKSFAIYKELEAQYKIFKEITHGKADYDHIDFHMWYNLTLPCAIAMYFFLKINHIKTARIIGIHQESRPKLKRLARISMNTKIKTYPATNIDYFISKKNDLFVKEDGIIELYCHPNFKNGILLDDSPSYLKHDRQPMAYHIGLLKGLKDLNFVSWADI